MLSNNPISFLAKEVAKVSMSPDVNTVCHVQSMGMGVTKNATFVIDVNDVAFSDLKTDNLSTWCITSMVHTNCFTASLLTLNLFFTFVLGINIVHFWCLQLHIKMVNVTNMLCCSTILMVLK